MNSGGDLKHTRPSSNELSIQLRNRALIARDDMSPVTDEELKSMFSELIREVDVLLGSRTGSNTLPNCFSVMTQQSYIKGQIYLLGFPESDDHAIPFKTVAIISHVNLPIANRTLARSRDASLLDPPRARTLNEPPLTKPGAAFLRFFAGYLDMLVFLDTIGAFQTRSPVANAMDLIAE
jgi:hypothetical protein